MKKLFPFVAFLMLALALYDALLMPKSGADANDIALPVTAIPALKGKEILNLAAMGNDVVVLNFFASWCAPCLAEFPQLRELKKRHPHVKIYGIAWNDTAEVLSPWLKKNQNPFDTVWLDEQGKASVAMGIRGIPETFIVDRNGKIRHHVVGEIRAEALTESISPLLDALEAEHAAH